MDRPPGFELTEAGCKSFRAFNSSPRGIPPSKVLCPRLTQGTLCDCFSFGPQHARPSASPYQFVDSAPRASSLIVPALNNLISSVPLSAPSSTALPSVDTLTPLPADCPSTSSPTDIFPSDQSPVDPGTKSPESYFANALRISKHGEKVELLARVVRGFPTAKGFSNGLKERFSEWSEFFPSRAELEFEHGFEVRVAHRFRRLKYARHEIQRTDCGYTRLWLVCLAHEIEYISQWEHINHYTSRGVDAMSAAMKMATKYLRTARGDYKRARNIVQAMGIGGPALMLENGGVSQAQWESFMTLDNITCIFAFVRDELPGLDEEAKSHNSYVSKKIVKILEKYGLSKSELLESKTQVMEILKSHASDGSESEPQYTRGRADQPGALASLNHGFPGKSLHLARNSLDQAPSGSSSNLNATPAWKPSHLSSSGMRNEIDIPMDTAMGNLDSTVHGSDQFTNTATASILDYTVNTQDEFADPSTANNLGHVNSSGEITDLNTADFGQSIHNYYETDPCTIELFQWPITGSDMLIDPSVDIFLLQGVTSPHQIYSMDNLIQPHDQRLPYANQLDPRTISSQTATGI